ncbi:MULTISPECIES: flavin reductase family protein [Thermus]|uniref:Phenol hydroxylase component B n=2 Tax=Thermus TaxID=270 RepID=Q53WI2_THET8|nr:MULTISPECIES: flavin reductase family protein [Thermus]BAD72040.1 phenol hydroxylase component B [Thermus thermophilus HB8]HAR68834.1 flavin reductase [Thermus scotoductus]KHG65706.1 flavin oxidoreductase [Thermus sp. 2.9]BDA38674.1 flavin oxidoreductase [Thermus thermophilus]BDE46485.1 flavin oxidoreductase [Thermus thermophilus]
MIDPTEFRRTLGRFATGVTVVSAYDEGGNPRGLTANAFMSVSLDPPLVLVSLDNRSRTKPVLERAGRYGVSVLAEEQRALSDHFAGRPQEGLEIAFEERAGVPLLKGALAQVAARVVAVYPGGDHTLFLGEVEYLSWREGRPLLYYAGRYGRLGEWG